MSTSSQLQRSAALLREVALGYPQVHEDHPWGELAFKVGAKVFLFLSVAPERVSLSVKLPHSGTAALDRPFAEPTHYGLGKHGWVTASFGPGDAPPIPLLRAWIDESYRAIAPKKVVSLLAGGAAPTAPAREVRKSAVKRVPAARRRGAR